MVKEESKRKSHVGDRFVAGLLDYIIIFAFTFIYAEMFGTPNDEGGYSVTGLPALGIPLFWGFMTIGFEQLFGATLGNLILGLKPISLLENEKLTFGQSLKRHLLDPIDMFFFGIIGIITIKNSDKNQRVGDIWAHTTVVKKSELN